MSSPILFSISLILSVVCVAIAMSGVVVDEKEIQEIAFEISDPPQQVIDAYDQNLWWDERTQLTLLKHKVEDDEWTIVTKKLQVEASVKEPNGRCLSVTYHVYSGAKDYDSIKDNLIGVRL
jgi:hypothetical protein